MFDFCEFLADHQMTPNGYYLLECIQRKMVPKAINVQLELRFLKNGGWLTEQNQPTEKTLPFLEDIDKMFTLKVKKAALKVMGNTYGDNVKKYRELFPTGRIPSGTLARYSENELTIRFRWFFANFKYDWDTILKVTEEYVENFAASGYKGMRNSKYFIWKQEEDGSYISDLANECQNYLESEKEQPPQSHTQIL